MRNLKSCCLLWMKNHLPQGSSLRKKLKKKIAVVLSVLLKQLLLKLKCLLVNQKRSAINFHNDKIWWWNENYSHLCFKKSFYIYTFTYLKFMLLNPSEINILSFYFFFVKKWRCKKRNIRWYLLILTFSQNHHL